MAERYYQAAGGSRSSVHLADWPSIDIDLKKNIIEEMKRVRQVVEIGHALRAECGLKVRQPLAQLVSNAKELEAALVEIIKEELNVKEVHFGQKKPKGIEFKIKEGFGFWVALDTTLTDELKEEGAVREIIRQINALRKEAKLTLEDRIELVYYCDDGFLNKLTEIYKNKIAKEVLASRLKKIKEEEWKNFSFRKDLKLAGQSLKVGFNK